MIIRYKIFLVFAVSIFICSPAVIDAGFAQGKNREIKIKDKPQNSESDGVVLTGADEGEYIKLADSGDGTIILRGNIKMESRGSTVLSKKVIYNRETGDITFLDDVLFSDGTNQIKAQKCVYNIKERAGVLYDAESLKAPVFFKTDKLRIVNKESYVTEKTDATTCDLEKPHYHFLISKLWIYSDKRAVAYNAVYVVGDIPVFYLPVLVQTDEGIGILTQLGQSNRRGYFMQNTVKYVFSNKDRWKYKFDIYEKMGYYGGVEYSKTTGNFYTDIYLGGARYKPVDGSLNNTTLLPDENWYKAIVNSNYSFFRRDDANSYYNLNFTWMNNFEFTRQFDNRHEPKNTLEMIRAPIMVMDPERYLKWIFTLGDRGDRHNISLSFERLWRWNDENISPDSVDNYHLKGLYMPHSDKLPAFGFDYSNSFFLFGEPGKSGKKDQSGHLINWNIHLDGEANKQYKLGELFKTYYFCSGYYYIYTVFPVFQYFTYSPGAKLGFLAKWVTDPDKQTRKDSERAADRNSYEYAEASNAFKLGPAKYYFQLTHFYRRSFLEKEVTLPFIHEKRNYFEGGLYLFPFSGIDMAVTTAYDARKEFPFNDERLKDVNVINNIFLDLYGIVKNKTPGRNAGLFYSGVSLSNNYRYITKANEPGSNNLDLSYTTGNFSLPGIKSIRTLELGYVFFHDFRYSFRDMMSIKWGIEAEISRLWRFGIWGNSQADRAYMYYNENYNVNIFDDMEKSLYYYDRDKSKGAVFTLRNLTISVIHDLHCWELGLYYDMRRQVENAGIGGRDRLIYYEQSIFVALTLKTFSGRGFDKTQVYPLNKATRGEK